MQIRDRARCAVREKLNLRIKAVILESYQDYEMEGSGMKHIIVDGKRFNNKAAEQFLKGTQLTIHTHNCYCTRCLATLYDIWNMP